MKKDTAEIITKCAVCDKSITSVPGRRPKVYCSSDCRQKAFIQRNKDKLVSSALGIIQENYKEGGLYRFENGVFVEIFIGFNGEVLDENSEDKHQYTFLKSGAFGIGILKADGTLKEISGKDYFKTNSPSPSTILPDSKERDPKDVERDGNGIMIGEIDPGIKINMGSRKNYNKTDITIPPIPVREKGENAIDFAIRKNEWKSKNKLL